MKKNSVNTMTNDTFCLGCGIKLQDTNPKMPGYINSLENKFCKSCFELKNYGIARDHTHPNQLPKITNNSVVLMISSVMNLDMLFSYPIWEVTKKSKIVYIINQIDLLPTSTNLGNLIDNITKEAKRRRVRYHDIILMSAKNKHDIVNLKEYVKHFQEENIYLLGVQNSGKTTIYRELTGDMAPLAMIKAALTQEVISGNFENKIIFDMPGLYQAGYLHEFLSYEEYKKLIPTTLIKPKIYQLKPNQAFFIEGLISFEIITSVAQPYVLYFDNMVKIHVTNTNRIAEIWKNLPLHQEVTYKGSLDSVIFDIKTNEKNQITIADLGIIHFDFPAKIKLTFPKGMHVSHTVGLFK